MDNYKIKVKDEAESKEAQELFVQLGFEKTGFSCDEFPCYLATWGGGFSDYVLDSLSISRERKELTLPQLRDLVVLKRNDVKDATHEDQYGDKWLYLDERHYVYLNYQWSLPTGEFLERYELKPIEKSQPQAPALISGDVALANVHKCIVQYLHDDEPYGRWTTITDHFWSQYHLGMFLDPDTKFKFRFKPQTIKVELELPKPFEPEEDCHVYILDDGKTDGYRRYSYEVHGDKGNTFIGIWRTKEEIKQVVEQLRKIRGTNS
ncbi:hypothetical protein ABTP57_04625 [Acinetobacter baumannii]